MKREHLKILFLDIDGVCNNRKTRERQGDTKFIGIKPELLECERLQAFPDNWTKIGSDELEISDTQRYKMCGNAVTTNVIQAIFERIFA